MLAAGLTRSRTRDGAVRPLFIDISDEQCRETAATLIALFEDHLGEPKEELDNAIDELTVADTDYKIVQGLAKLLRDECEFEQRAAVGPREIRERLFERVNDRYPIVRQPTFGEDTQKLEICSAVADELGISLEECYRGVYADLEGNKWLVRFGDQLIRDDSDGQESTTTTTKLTGSSKQAYDQRDRTVDWLLARYNLALAQAMLYGTSEMHFRVQERFGTMFSYMRLFGLIHRVYPIGKDGSRVASTDMAAGYETKLGGPVSLFRQSQEYDIRTASFLPTLPLCDRWEMRTEILDEGSAGDTKQFTLDRTDGLVSHYSTGQRFDSDVERMLTREQKQSTTEWDLQREDNVFDLGSEAMVPDFTIEYPDGRRAIMEIVGFWTPEHLASRLVKIRQVETHDFALVVSERLDCSDEGFGDAADRVLWFKTRMHVYDMAELAEECASPVETDPD